jgi:two-component system, response regulator
MRELPAFARSLEERLMRHSCEVILIVDDDENDRFLMERTLKQLRPALVIRSVADGAEALDYIDAKGPFHDRDRYPFPTFLFVDLKMPKVDGFQVLSHVKSNPKWAIIPSVVVSASADADDVKSAFLAGAAAYHVKPTSVEERKKLYKLLLDYWMTSEVPQTDKYGEVMQTESTGKLSQQWTPKRVGAQ